MELFKHPLEQVFHLLLIVTVLDAKVFVAAPKAASDFLVSLANLRKLGVGFDNQQDATQMSRGLGWFETGNLPMNGHPILAKGVQLLDMENREDCVCSNLALERARRNDILGFKQQGSSVGKWMIHWRFSASLAVAVGHGGGSERGICCSCLRWDARVGLTRGSGN